MSDSRETQPLLLDQSPAAYDGSTATIVDVESGRPKADVQQTISEAGDDDDVEEEKVKLTKGQIAWRVLLWTLGAFALVVFVKGFIDAKDVDFDLGKTLKRALGGGLSGAAAMVLQVLSLMPIRTVMNYQYRYGTSLTSATKTLYAQGGMSRYYQGLSAALVQGPISRFGDTAANVGILALLQGNKYLKNLPELGKTVFASVAAALWRMVLTPVDTVKTTLQTEGREGWGVLKARLKRYGVTTLWYGAWATAAATFVGHYPWFGTYNYLNAHLPPPTNLLTKLLRQAVIGFVASVVSDTISNSLRVVKTYRQTNRKPISYMGAAKEVIRVDGIRGLFGRGLKTRILANGLQGIIFSVLWKVFMDLWNDNTEH